MTTLREAAQRLLQAVDAALPYAPHRSEFDVVADTADDLRAALSNIDWQGYVETPTHPKSPDVMQPLYTAPPQCKPLTEQEIINIGKAAEPVQLAYKRIGCVGHDCDECQHRALAEPVQEPVAWMDIAEDGTRLDVRMWSDGNREEAPLYLAPPQRKPLTEEAMRECAQAMDAEPLEEGWPELIKFARAIERVHGIGG